MSQLLVFCGCESVSISVDSIVFQELRELETEDEKKILKESTGSSRLGKKVDVMINKIEERLKLIETDIDDQPTQHQLDADGCVMTFVVPFCFILFWQ